LLLCRAHYTLPRGSRRQEAWERCFSDVFERVDFQTMDCLKGHRLSRAGQRLSNRGRRRRHERQRWWLFFKDCCEPENITAYIQCLQSMLILAMEWNPCMSMPNRACECREET
jgi:hypothetical protein